MAQNLKIERSATRDIIAGEFRNDLLKEALRRAEEIRRGFEGRQHTDSTKLVSENRQL
jgi:vacuolar-type H+-ATPase subunit H